TPGTIRASTLMRASWPGTWQTFFSVACCQPSDPRTSKSICANLEQVHPKLQSEGVFLMATTTVETTKQLIQYRTDAGVAVITMDDPPANTYTYEMNRQLDDAILKARMDNDVYVILLTGSGDKFFSAGANIRMLSQVDPTFKYYFCLHANE